MEVKALIHRETESCGNLADKTIVESGTVLPVNFHQVLPGLPLTEERNAFPNTKESAFKAPQGYKTCLTIWEDSTFPEVAKARLTVTATTVSWEKERPSEVVSGD